MPTPKRQNLFPSTDTKSHVREMRLLTFVSSADQSPHFELVVTLKPVGGLRRVSVCLSVRVRVCVWRVL